MDVFKINGDDDDVEVVRRGRLRWFGHVKWGWLGEGLKKCGGGRGRDVWVEGGKLGINV